MVLYDKPHTFSFTEILQTDLQFYLTRACVCIVLLLAWFLNCLGGCHSMHLLYFCVISFHTNFLVNMGISMHMFLCLVNAFMVVHLTFVWHTWHTCMSQSVSFKSVSVLYCIFEKFRSTVTACFPFTLYYLGEIFVSLLTVFACIFIVAAWVVIINHAQWFSFCGFMLLTCICT